MAKTQGELIAAIEATIFQNNNKSVSGAVMQARMLEMTDTLKDQSDSSLNIPISGASADATFVNGSTNITGVNTSFYNGAVYVTFSTEEEWYLINIIAVDSTNAIISSHFNLVTDPRKQNDLGTEWIGPSLTTRLYEKANVLKNSNNVLVNGYGNIFINAFDSIVIGNNNIIEGPSCTVIGGDLCQVAGSTNRILYPIGANQIKSAANLCTMLGCGSDSIIWKGSRLSLIGLPNGSEISYPPNIAPTLNNLTIGSAFMSFNIVPEFADNAAAISGGLQIGQEYRTGDFKKVVH
jgi:hypothetical protein